MTKSETEILGKDLDYCFYPYNINHLKIKVEFEKAYSKIKRHLAPKDILDLKLKILNLCKIYPPSLNRGNTIMLIRAELQEAHNSLRKQNSMVVNKLGKGNGVVVLNRTDYVSMDNI